MEYIEKLFKLKQAISDAENQMRYAQREYQDFLKENAEKIFENTFWKNEYADYKTVYCFCKRVERNFKHFGEQPVYFMDSFAIKHNKISDVIQQFSDNTFTTECNSHFKTKITREEYEEAFEVFKIQIGKFFTIERKILLEKHK